MLSSFVCNRWTITVSCLETEYIKASSQYRKWKWKKRTWWLLIRCNCLLPTCKCGRDALPDALFLQSFDTAGWLTERQRQTFAYYRSWSVAPNSPDLNSSEDKICSITSIRQHVYETSINNIDKLKQQLTEVWSRLQQNIVDAATGKCRKRLQACVCTQWKHFEHLLYDYRKFSLSSRLNVFINVRLTKWVFEWRENVS